MFSTKEAMDATKKAMVADNPSKGGSYAHSWHCNIAVCAIDEGIDHATANKIASRFMKLAFDVETKQCT